MSNNVKIFIIIFLFVVLLNILNAPIDENIGTFSRLGLLSMGCRICSMIIGGAVGFNLCLDLEKKKREKLLEDSKTAVTEETDET